MEKETPAIFWHSDPVLPDETVVISGHAFEKSSKVELSLDGEKWINAEIAQYSEGCLKAVIPAEWKMGAYFCRINDSGKRSETITINAPDAWWVQGAKGLAASAPGRWVRVFGKCLNFGGTSSIEMTDGKKKIKIKAEKADCWNLRFKLPDDIANGKYFVTISNGFSKENAGSIEVNSEKKPASAIANVVELGADPTGKKDATVSIIGAVERLQGLGGGTIYFPRGRYRIDSILRSGMWIKTPLKIPSGIKLKGESKETVSLWWPDMQEPVASLIEGGDDFAVENLTIYTQGRHRNIITGENNVTIKNVRIRANAYYMCGNDGVRPHHGRKIEESRCEMGAAIDISGKNCVIEDCDIFHSNLAFFLHHVMGGVIARNKIRAGNMMALSGGKGIIFEDNEFSGNSLTAGGNNIALHHGASSFSNVYYARNKVSHIYGGDHEALTLDGHGTAYFGRISKAEGTSLTLLNDPPLGSDCKDAMIYMDGTVVYILAGRGAGQLRHVTASSGKKVSIEKPWLVEPDATSIISIGGFNGRHLIIGNTAEDTGTAIQLYPPNCECIVAENKSIRASNINSVGKLGINRESPVVRCEPSWRNQFLENHIIEGNCWGGGETEVDRWIGGETALQIWGWQVSFETDGHGAHHNEFLSKSNLEELLGEWKRSKSLPLSRFQIVRRHKIDNNSYIRIRGSVQDVLVEGGVIKDSKKGIRVGAEIKRPHPTGLGQLDFEQEPVPEDKIINFIAPTNVLIRKNSFKNVDIPYSGTAIKTAFISDEIKT